MKTTDELVDMIFTMQENSDVKRGRRQSIFKHVAKLTEEVGEFAEAMLEEDGYKTNKKDKVEILKEAKKEVIDMFIMVMVLAHQLGMKREDFAKLAAGKLKKWQKKHIAPLKKSS